MRDEIQRQVIPGSLTPPGINVTTHPRCGDTDRQRAADRVSEAYARGFIDRGEAEARQEAISQATLGAHLELVTGDIPAMSRWKGASLPSRTQSRVEIWAKWWTDRQPWSGVLGMLTGLLSGIAPTVTAHALRLGEWVPVSAAVTIPVGSIAFITGLVSLAVWSVEIS